MSDALMTAARCYNKRRRYSHNAPFERYYPRGEVRTRFTVTEDKFDCCQSQFKDFTAHLQHCRSAVHIATMYGVDRVELLRTARQLRVLEALEQA